jgi:hypothetical protein
MDGEKLAVFLIFHCGYILNDEFVHNLRHAYARLGGACTKILHRLHIQIERELVLPLGFTGKLFRCLILHTPDYTVVDTINIYYIIWYKLSDNMSDKYRGLRSRYVVGGNLGQD